MSNSGPIIWHSTDPANRSDLSDDCVTDPWHGLVGRAECMGEVRTVRDPEDGASERTLEDWWGAVYDADGKEVWSTNITGGFIGGPVATASSCIRGVVELAMRAHVARRGVSD
jgi:hypothetical protein